MSARLAVCHDRSLYTHARLNTFPYIACWCTHCLRTQLSCWSRSSLPLLQWRVVAAVVCAAIAACHWSLLPRAAAACGAATVDAASASFSFSGSLAALSLSERCDAVREWHGGGETGCCFRCCVAMAAGEHERVDSTAGTVCALHSLERSGGGSAISAQWPLWTVCGFPAFSSLQLVPACSDDQSIRR